MISAIRLLSLPSTLLALVGAASAQEATSTFGHARARELAELGRLPSAADIVVRDLVNYHRHRLPLPKAGQELALDLRFDRDAAAPGDDVWLQVGYTTSPQGDRALAQPCSVALVVDCSGSMAEAGKMTEVQAGLRAFVGRLRPDDEVALITFASEAQVLAERARRGDGRWLDDAIARLVPGGSTNLSAGLMLGLQQLAHDDDGPRHRRVVLLTDGIANRGITEPNRLLDDVRPLVATGIDIATIGVGQNLDVALLQRLAAGARGLFHFVADAVDVEKVFVDEADSLLTPVARDVHLDVELPANLDVLRVAQEGSRCSEGHVELSLPDLNSGVTGVVMIHCRVHAAARDVFAHATLTATSAASARPLSLECQAPMRVATGYTIQRGDSLEHIAAHELGDRSRGDDIARCNPELDAQRLRVGQRINLPGSAIDLEVLKNAAIAVMAEGLADMAQSCDQKRWADADRTLRAANDDARRLFPGDDTDVQRVRDIVAGHQKTLTRYVDRFRDL